MNPLNDKLDGGLELCPSPVLELPCPKCLSFCPNEDICHFRQVKWKLEQEVLNTGNLLSSSLALDDSLGYERMCPSPVTGNLLSTENQPWRTSPRMTLQLPDPDSKWDSDQLTDLRLLIGTRYAGSPAADVWKACPVIYTLDIIGRSKQFMWTTWNQLQLKEWFTSIMASQEPVKHIGPGQRPVWTLTLKIQLPNGGAAIELNRELSLMSLEVVSTSATCFDGLISIQSQLKQKEARFPWWPMNYGLPPISTLKNGTPTWIKKRKPRFYAGSR